MTGPQSMSSRVGRILGYIRSLAVDVYMFRWFKVEGVLNKCVVYVTSVSPNNRYTLDSDPHIHIFISIN